MPATRARMRTRPGRLAGSSVHRPLTMSVDKGKGCAVLIDSYRKGLGVGNCEGWTALESQGLCLLGEPKKAARSPILELDLGATSKV